MIAFLICLTYEADSAIASVKVGIHIPKALPELIVGSHLSLTPSIKIRSIAIKKPGIEPLINERTLSTTSIHLFSNTAQRIPSGIDTANVRAIESAVNLRVLGK